MPAIEEFVEQAAAVAQEEADCSSAHETPTDEGDEKEAAGDAGGVPGRWQSSVEGAVGNPASVSFKEVRARGRCGDDRAWRRKYRQNHRSPVSHPLLVSRTFFGM